MITEFLLNKALNKTLSKTPISFSDSVAREIKALHFNLGVVSSNLTLTYVKLYIQQKSLNNHHLCEGHGGAVVIHMSLADKVARETLV